ncbi:hypothetical protein PhCBS80983_g05570 [Powellomyces hirtus]|uniref:RCC1-like domain-containing protein n=1 Tax=Powellomyces hirtus TaxID=109895 RepID=A0A507DW14_9FUNG|nr:hypothetical protein PhCBS80983_g05570 [Powellomyces hirtus]
MSLWAFGSNAHGQLGVGTGDDAHVPTRSIFQDAHGSTIEPIPVSISGGANHSVIVTSRGEVFSSGRNDVGQIGLAESEDRLVFTRVKGIDGAVGVSCGWDHTAVLTGSGEVYVFGSNKYGQLGVGAPVSSTHQPTKVPGLPGNVKKVACGMRFTMVVTEDGEVWAWGSNRHGEVGLVAKSAAGIIFDPVRVPINAVDVACGQYHTVYLNTDGVLVCCGRNRHGQLSGTDKTITSNQIPATKDGAVRTIFAGWSFSGFLDTYSGTVTGWGRNDHAQLAIPPASICASPTRSTCLTNVQQIACGSEHALGLDATGTCYAWGWNEHGNCGVGNTADVLEPRAIVMSAPVTLVGCGYGHSIIFTQPAVQ